MRDTEPEVDRRYREMLLARSGEDRLRMGCSMYSAVRALAVASILERRPGASAAEIRQALFLRFYGSDFSAEEKQRILGVLGAGPDQSTSDMEGLEGSQQRADAAS